MPVIHLEPSRIGSLKQIVLDSIENGDYDNLCDDIHDCFTSDQITQIEELLDSGDIAEAIDDIVSDWGADDEQELFELITTYFLESNIEIILDFDNDDFEDETTTEYNSREEEDDNFEALTSDEEEENGDYTED